MNHKIIFLVGLPGSGKTFYGDILSKEYNCKFFDDISISGVDDLKEYLNSRNFKQEKNSVVVVADVFCCYELTRIKATKYLAEFNINIEWVFFENNPIKYLINVQNRNDGRAVKELIDILSKSYSIPEGANIKPVFSP